MVARLRNRVDEFLFPLTSGLRPTRLDDLLSGCKSLQPVLADWDKDPGAGSLFDLITIVAVVAHRRPRLCVEIGTGQGRTTLHLALNAPDDASIVTVDLLPYPQSGRCFHEHPAGARVETRIGDSKTFDFSPWKGRADLVYIDGDHSREAVMRDTATAMDLLAPGGCIIWDDVHPSWQGVVSALKHLNRDGRIRRVVGTKLAFYD